MGNASDNMTGWKQLRFGLMAAAALVLLMAGILGASVMTTPAHAQEDPGAISNLSVSSPESGQLVVAWDAPAEAPTDYRVRWAPSDQDYLSFSEANTAQRGSAYPTGTSHTVNNLAAGASYKVQARARYNGGEHAGNPWSGPWSGEATVTISSPPPPPEPDPTPEPTPATDVVTNIALSSGAAGELAITWTQPSEAPTDYRISWTPAGEEYLSYSKENTSRRGNSYPDGSATSLTLTGLPGGINYKVMMRSRYHDEQTNEDSSGPWSDEATQRILNSPPAAPTGLNAVEVSDSSITLSWTAPSGEVTGYRVMRGPTAAKQGVLENNTGSTETEYLDSEVEAGTEYHYSVRTINDAGVGPASNSIAVTAGDDQTIVVRQDNVGTVTFSPTQPDLGIPITASVTDPGGAVTAEMWQWSKSDTADGDFTDITGATNATYRPAEADLGKFLKASVTYTVSMDSGKSASAVTDAVQVVDRILVSNLGLPLTHETYGSPGITQAFRPGGHPNGYKLSHIIVETRTTVGNLVVKIFTTTTPAREFDKSADEELYALTHRSGTANWKTYDFPAGARLDPNQTYHLALLPQSGATTTCLTTSDTTEESPSAQDWTIIHQVLRTNAAGQSTATAFANSSCKFRLSGQAAKDEPHITDLSYSTEPTQTRTYDTGDIIKVAATFSEAVGVSSTDPPTLPLKIGSNTRTASYVSGDSSTTKLVFSYVVVAADRDDDGITIEQNSLTGGITRLNSTVAADLDHAADNNNPDRLVNAAPTVTSVRITSSPVAPNWYTTGETIEITVTFSIPITVEGDPHFEFSLDQVDTPADYAASASETNTMVFQYTVLATDEDTNGIWIGDQSRTFKLDSDDFIKDSLRTTGQKAAVLTHSGLSTQGSHRISPLPRLALSVTSDPRSGSGSDTYGVGEMIEFTATFNQDITVTGDPQHAFSLLDDGGDIATERRVADYQASLSGARTAVFTYTVVAADSDDNGIFLWGHGGSNTSFDLDADDTIQNSANADAVLDYARHRTQTGHKVDGSLTPPITSPFNPPAFDVDSIMFNLAENTAGRVTVGNVVATDADGDTVHYVLGGPDAAAFTSETSLSQPGASIILQVFTAVDYETKQSYSLVLSVTDHEDEDGNQEADPTVDDTVQITVNVLNVEEPGRLVLQPDSLEQGINATVSLTDPDGSLSNIGWQWSRSDSGSGPFSDITEENGPNYVPVLPDKHKFLKVRVTYTDGHGSGKSAELITYVYAGTTTAEPTPVDFPKTGRTMGALRIGETSTGRLDPVDDNLHAPEHDSRIPRGDLLRIEGLTAGNSYRVRAWFGTSKEDSATAARGGAIGLQFSRSGIELASLSPHNDNLLDDGRASFVFPAFANDEYYVDLVAPAFRPPNGTFPAAIYFGPYMLEIYDLGPTKKQSQPEGYGIKATNICVNNRCYNDPRFPEFHDSKYPTNETHAVTVGNSPLANNFLRSTMFRAGNSTSPAAGFQLDRIGAFVHSMTSGSNPQAAIYSDIDGPAEKLFDLEPIYNDERHVDYFVAPRDAQALNRNWEYHVVFSEGGGDNESYKLYVTALTAEDDNRDPKWLITLTASTKDSKADNPIWNLTRLGDIPTGTPVYPQIRVYAGVAE